LISIKAAAAGCCDTGIMNDLAEHFGSGPFYPNQQRQHWIMLGLLASLLAAFLLYATRLAS
jgi:hypothetical protein